MRAESSASIASSALGGGPSADRRDADAGTRRGERPEQPEVLVVGRDDLVVWLEPEAGDGDVAAVGRRPRERDVLGRRADEARDRRPDAGPRRAGPLPVVRAGAAVLELARALGDHHLDRPARERTERAGVQVGEAFEDGQLGANLVEVHGTIISASTGAWSESRRPGPARRRSSGQASGPREEAETADQDLVDARERRARSPAEVGAGARGVRLRSPQTTIGSSGGRPSALAHELELGQAASARLVRCRLTTTPSRRPTRTTRSRASWHIRRSAPHARVQPLRPERCDLDGPRARRAIAFA